MTDLSKSAAAIDTSAERVDLPPLPVSHRPAGYTTDLYTADQMRAYAAAAVAAERNACADICDQHASVEGVAQQCAAAIRKRGQA